MTSRFLGFLLAVPLLAATPPVRSDMLVSTGWLAQHLNDPNVVVIQVSRDRSAYDAGHIPGARYLGFSEIVTTRDGVLNELPPAADLKQIFERAGVSDDSRVILYGDESVLPATRAYFTLDYLGHGDQTALLDGGLAKWRAESRAVTKDAPNVTAGHFTPRPRPEVVIGIDAVEDLSWTAKNAPSAGAVLVDARPNDQYKDGHIPGAVSLYWMEDQTSKDNAALRPEPELRKLYESAGVSPGRPVVTYCTSGIQATQSYFTLKYLGYDVHLFDGSMSQWKSVKGTTVDK